MNMLWIILFMLIAFWAMSALVRRQQQKMLAEQARRTEEALVPGTWVRTSAGFYGTVVEVDGDVVTLATPLGEESLWGKRFIVGAEEPPFASTHEEEPDQEVEDVEAVEDVEDEAEDVKDVGAEAADEPVEAADDEQSGA